MPTSGQPTEDKLSGIFGISLSHNVMLGLKGDVIFLFFIFIFYFTSFVSFLPPSLPPLTSFFPLLWVLYLYIMAFSFVLLWDS